MTRPAASGTRASSIASPHGEDIAPGRSQHGCGQETGPGQQETPTVGRRDRRSRTSIESVDVGVYEIPTDQPEADGTLAWGSTTLILVEVRAGGKTGLGWTYAGASSAHVVSGQLADICAGMDPFDVLGLNEAMIRACRNLGGAGVVACAISAVDIALWDLKARLVGSSLTGLFGQVRRDVPIYGSGGFTTYDDATACAQLEQLGAGNGTSPG